MGGTFPARTLGYQRRFIKGCLDALNGYVHDSLEEAIKTNEKAENRCIGLTVETRPDQCSDQQIADMLSYGTTRVELGVQSLRNDILEGIDRGHTVEDSIEATERCKDAGIKVCYHMMPGLPGTTSEEDLKDFKKLFHDNRFRPDMLKIYPTLVVEGTELYEMWSSGGYEPLGTGEAAELIAKVKSIVPEYVRIQRVQRDIPSQLIEAGVKKSNLRQYAWEVMEEQGSSCRCIRCREAGRSDKEVKDIELRHISYEASDGTEHFFELGDGDLLVGYARLRMKENMIPTLRELKVVGKMTPLDSEPISYQHTGYGTILLNSCEDKALGYGRIRVTSGIGAREYYRDHGYELKGPYMFKDLQ